MAVTLDNQDVMLDDQNRGNPTKTATKSKPGTGTYDLLDEQSKGNPEKKPKEKTWQELFSQSYNQVPEQSGVYSAYSPEGIMQPWSIEETKVPEAAEYAAETDEVPQTMYYGTEPTEVVPENWEDTAWYGLLPNVRKGTSYGTEPSEVIPEGYEPQTIKAIGREFEYGERPEVVDQLAAAGAMEWVENLSPETQQLIAEYLAPTAYASAEEVMSAPEIFSVPGTTPTFDENGVRSNALTYDSYFNYLSGVDDLRKMYGDAKRTGGTNWDNMIWGIHDQPYLTEDPSGIAAGYDGKIRAEEMNQRKAKTLQQSDEATNNINTLEKERDEKIANYNPDDLSITSPNKTNAQAEEDLVNYLNKQLGRRNVGTGVTDLLTEEMLGNPEDKTTTTVGYDGTTTTDYSDPGGDLTKAASGQASGEFSLGQNPIQGKLAQAFYDKVNGDPEAADYYTSVQTEIFDNYANIWEETYGTKFPFTDLLDFMLNASGEDAWEFAQFAHSVFGMYSSYEGEDGSVDYAKFMQFYNNCKIYNTIDKLFNAEGQLVRDVVDVFGNDYDLANLTAEWLYKNGYTPQGKMDPAQLYAMAIAVMPDMGSDFYEANYNMMGDPTKVGGYVQGGDYSAQGRLPYTAWDYYDPEDISKLETAIGDNSIQYMDVPQLIDSIVFSKGYGWDTPNPRSENTSTNWHSRSNAYKTEEGEK